MIRYLIRLVLVIGISLFSTAPIFSQVSDSLTLEEVMDWALVNHPLAKMAQAIENRGMAAVLQANGYFDPKLSATYDTKDFQGTGYFDYGQTSLKWQSPFAVEFSAGYEWADGVYLNDERTVPSAGQAYLAIKLPLIQGLLNDKARTERYKSLIAEDLQLALAEVVRNELRYDVAMRYAEWHFASQVLRISQATEALIEVRRQNTQGLYLQGDKPAIDTLEAQVALGQQRLQTQQARIDEELARRKLAELFWPISSSNAATDPNSNWFQLPINGNWQLNQPVLQEQQFSIASLQLDQNYYREQLKPSLDVSYYLLADGLSFSPVVPGEDLGFFNRAYKFGVTAGYPIFNRKARGQLQLSRLKIEESTAKLNSKRQALETKAIALNNAFNQYLEQTSAAGRLISQAEQLLSLERQRFGLGESTQFLLNSREQSLQKARLSAAKLDFQLLKTAISYRYVIADWQ